MLAITANWGLCDGSLADARAARAAAWLEAIRRALVRAGWGRDGRYRPVSEVTLLFAGDTFDWLLSDRWAGQDRPWQGGSRGEEARAGVAAATLRAALPVLRTVARWTRSGLPVPAATPRDRPSEWAVQAVRIRPVVLAGDRDAWLTDHAVAAARFGITTGEEWSDGDRHVRHGHDLDPLSHRALAAAFRRGRPPTLAESLIIELVVPFAVAVRGDRDLWPWLRPRLAELSAAPPSQWPRLVGGIGAGIGAANRERSGIWSPWRRAVAAWHRFAVREVPTCETEFDALGALAAWLDGGRDDHSVPETIRRLDAPATRRRSAATHVALPGRPESPVLECRRPDGRAWVEHLGGPPPDSSVVAIGAGPPGSGFIDAA